MRQLRRVRRYLPQEAALKLAHAFVSCRLDYCNSVLFGLPQYLIARLQSVLNSSERLATRTSRFAHITPVLRELHWLPYPQRVTFKICLNVYKCLHGMAPHYLSSVCTRLGDLPGRSSLRSTSGWQLLVPRTKMKSCGDRSFRSCGPRLWNSLPLKLRDPSLSLPAFKGLLKTYLFTAV